MENSSFNFISDENLLYLINRKMFQLARLIDSLSFGLADKNFEKEFLLKQQEENIEEISKNSDKQVETLINDLNNYYTNKNKDFIDQKNEKLDFFREDFLQFLITKKSDLEEYEASIKSRIRNLNQTINKIMNDLKKQEDFFQLDSLKQKIDEIPIKLQTMESNHQLNIKFLEKENNKKLTELENETQLKLKELDKSFNSSMNKLKTTFKNSDMSSSAAMIKCNSIKDDVFFLKESLQQIKDNINHIIEENSRNNKRNRKNIQQIKEELCNINNSDVDQLNKSNYNTLDISSLEKEYQNMIELHNKKLKDAQQELMDMKEISKKMDELRSEQMENELNDLDNENEKQKKQMENNLLDWKKKKEEFEEIIRIKRKEKEFLITKNRKEEQEYLERLKLDLDIRKDELFQEIEKIQKRLKRLQNKNNSRKTENLNEEDLSKELELLKEEKKKVMKERKDLLNDPYSLDYDESFQAQIDEMNLNLENFRKQEDVYVAVLEKSYENAYESQIIRNNELLEEEKTKVEKEYENTQEIIVEIEKDYKKKLRKLQKLLNSIDVPEEYQEVQKQNENERQQQIASKNHEISQHKEKFIQNFMNELKEEENRHLNFIAAIDLLSSQQKYEREQEELNFIQQNLNFEIQKLQHELFLLKAFNPKDSNSYKEADELRENQEQLQNELDEANQNLDDQITEKFQIIQKEQKKLMSSINHSKRKYRDDTTKLRKQLIQETDSRDLEIDQVTQNLKQNQKNHREKIESYKEKLKADQQDKIDGFLQCVNAILKEQRDLAEQIQKNEKSFQKEKKRQKKKNKDNYSSEKQKCVQQITELDNQKTELIAKLEEQQKECEILLQKSKDHYLTKTPREEEMSQIERLKNQLLLLEKRQIQIAKDFKNIREELIANDDAITQRFGGAPTVNILRTPSIPVRPFTANSYSGTSSGLRIKRKSHPHINIK